MIKLFNPPFSLINLISDLTILDGKNLSAEDGGDNLHGTLMIVDERNLCAKDGKEKFCNT